MVSNMRLPPSFRNPVVWEDLPDMEVIRVGDIYYMSCSTFHYSPGAAVLRSFNLMDWEHIGHSVPKLFGDRFSLDGEHSGSYIKGVWASTMRFRPSNGLFYWYGPLQGTERTFIFTAKDPAGDWTPLKPIEKFCYDLGLLVDEDDTMYLAYGTKTIHVSKLSADGQEEIESQAVYTSDEYLEGARMYNIGGVYYIWLTRPHSGQYVLKSTHGPFGPYVCRRVIGAMLSPIAGSGYPHQGALIDTPDGRWYYMAFMDAYPAGRAPVLAPVIFDDNGWPTVEADYSKDDGQWGLEYPCVTRGKNPQRGNACFKKHLFQSSKLDHCWEWNHNPDNSKWVTSDGHLRLKTGSVTDNLFLATNTLTHRVIGPKSMATFCVNTQGMMDGDRAGACMLRYNSAYIGLHRIGTSTELVYVDDLLMEPVTVPVGWVNAHPVALDWRVKSKGTVKEQISLPESRSRLWLRVKADIRAAFTQGYEKESRATTFEYSYDGKHFQQFGQIFILNNSADGWIAYRFGIFNFATKALGGEVAVENCNIEPW